MDRNDNLTALRGIFCVCVVLFHYSDLPTIGSYPFLAALARLGLTPFIRHSYLAVYFFFLLSGYVLAQRYLVTRGEPRTFLRRRLLRLFPAHLFFLALYALGKLTGLLTLHRLYWGALPEHLLLLQNLRQHRWGFWNFPAWTLSSEFLLALALTLLLCIHRRWGRTALLAALALGLALPFLLSAPTRDDFLNLRLYQEDLRFFLVGVALAFLPSPKSRFALLLAFAGLIGSVVCIHYDLLWPLLPALACLVWGFSAPGKTYASRLSVTVGERSFSLFLAHIPVLDFVGALTKSWPPGASLATLFASLAVMTELTYRMWEKKLYLSWR